MTTTRRELLALGAAGALVLGSPMPVTAQARRKLRFGVGPLLPNPEDTKKAYTPLFAHLAQQLDVDFDLVT